MYKIGKCHFISQYYLLPMQQQILLDKKDHVGSQYQSILTRWGYWPGEDKNPSRKKYMLFCCFAIAVQHLCGLDTLDT